MRWRVAVMVAWVVAAGSCLPPRPSAPASDNGTVADSVADSPAGDLAPSDAHRLADDGQLADHVAPDGPASEVSDAAELDATAELPPPVDTPEDETAFSDLLGDSGPETVGDSMEPFDFRDIPALPDAVLDAVPDAVDHQDLRPPDLELSDGGVDDVGPDLEVGPEAEQGSDLVGDQAPGDDGPACVDQCDHEGASRCELLQVLTCQRGQEGCLEWVFTALCDDANPCTTDSCQQGICHFAPVPQSPLCPTVPLLVNGGLATSAATMTDPVFRIRSIIMSSWFYGRSRDATYQVEALAPGLPGPRSTLPSLP